MVFKYGLLVSPVFTHANDVNTWIGSFFKFCVLFDCCRFAVVCQANGCCAPTLFDTELHPVVERHFWFTLFCSHLLDCIEIELGSPAFGGSPLIRADQRFSLLTRSAVAKTAGAQEPRNPQNGYVRVVKICHYTMTVAEDIFRGLRIHQNNACFFSWH